ncbi:dihydrolipoyl dehydrogenase [Stenotrophomonas sp. 9(2022)]|uniref:dihydrolipoyl dehydrogenase n=1 Tax=Stenotrophomonas sp. 9(2022) TaxID=2950153 RepID=UPI0021139390|nr:dihydrolipoyl dehydrogenase [Stenotrophomonas sp. 9(2022)]
MSTPLHCDVAVIGAGTAGLAAERAARRNGASTLLIDPHFSGTTCANVGCMPSKLLLAAATQAEHVRRSDLFGIHVDGMTIDDAAVMRRVREERDRFAALTRKQIDKLDPATRLTGRARFAGPTTLELEDGRRIEARAIVIATGSAPALPPPFEALGDRVLTNESLFELEQLPKRVAVVGTGSLGLEFAQALARLGVQVTLLGKETTLAKVRCPRVRDALLAVLKRDIEVHLGVDVQPERSDEGVHVRWSGKDQADGSVKVDFVVAALGRPPNLDDLALDKAQLALDKHGVPCHDRETMRCGDSAVFMAGDAAADLPLLHEASSDGAIAGRNAAAMPAKITVKRHVPLSITFTDPPVATIGQSEEEGAVTGTSDFDDQGRARVEGVNEGTLTLYAAAPEGKLIGADLVAPAGEHLAHLLAWAVETGCTASRLLELPFYHPTMEEGLKQALRSICAATPIALPADHDAGAPSGG